MYLTDHCTLAHAALDGAPVCVGCFRQHVTDRESRVRAHKLRL